jgi:hypothetical protein
MSKTLILLFVEGDLKEEGAAHPLRKLLRLDAAITRSSLTEIGTIHYVIKVQPTKIPAVLQYKAAGAVL